MSSIKIRREVFAAKLQERLDASEKNRAKFEAESEKQKIKMEKAIQTFIAKAVKTKGLTYSAHINWRNTLSVCIENVPASLLADIQDAERPIDCEPTLSAWEKSEIEGAIRLLQLSEDEYISASFSKQFSKYL
jgi:hypothetical protein